jgi:hypothetical protein
VTRGLALPTAVVVAAALAGIARPASSQNSPYADQATAALVARARQRHLHQDSLVRDYRALVRTRFDASAGKSRFARSMPLLAHESVARVTWRAPNDLRVELLGARTKSQLSRFLPRDADVKDENIRVSFGDRPWFVPRALGDSVRLLGVPETAALHPLAPGAEAYYDYAITDSVTMYLPSHTLRAIAIRVRPRKLGPSLVAGDMWVDAETADVVRLMVTFLGEYLWDAPDSGASPKDSADARNDSRRAQDLLTIQADLEYSLLDDRYWMPYRQVLDITAEVNFLIRLAAPFRVITTFSDYRVNTDAPIAFEVPADSLSDRRTSRRYCPRCGDDERERKAEDVGYSRTGTWSNGRWEMEVPPADSLFAYPWTDTLRLEVDDATAEHIRQSVAELARLKEELPADLLLRRRFGLAWEDVADLVRFNRVQGASVGLGVRLRPRIAFTNVVLSGRYGFTDHRVTGSALLRRDAPGGLFEARAFRDVVEAEPWTQGQGIGNSMNALFAAHDDADYYLATGGAIGFTPFGGSFEDVDFRIGVEHQGSMDALATSGLNDALGGSGLFPSNPAVAGGDYVRASIRPTRRIGWSTLSFGVEGLVSDSLVGGRGWVAAQMPFRVLRHTGTLTLRTGYAVGDSIPQLQFRAGGPWTVRGYDYGFRRGAGAWSAQLDVALRRGWLWAPVVFADVGDVYRSGPFDPLVGLGGGVSFLGGLVRFNGSWGVNPESGFRFDLLFRAPR